MDAGEALSDIGKAAEIGGPLIGKVLDLIVRAASAKAEEHAQIIAALEASDAALESRAPATRQLVEEETAETQKLIDKANAEAEARRENAAKGDTP